MAGSASAGPVIEFETEFRAVYGDYRAALFMTNSGSVENSVSSLAVFSDGWAEIKADYATTPPPQYADDPHWAAMLAEVDALLAEAEKDIGAGDLAAAHATLEKVREVFSDLHLRNGIQTFSDRMNAYHAEMEHVLGIAPGTLTRADLPEMTGRAAVLVYLAQDVIAHPPRDAAGDAGFAKLIEGFRASVEALDAAVKAGDLEALRGAMGNLKKPYSMLFLKFG
jgi:hypothetical protein